MSHLSSNFIVRIFQITSLSLYKYSHFFKGLSISKPKPHKSLSETQTDYSSPVPPKAHSSLSSHPIEPYPTGQSSLDFKTTLNLNIDYYLLNNVDSPHNITWHHRGGTITQTIHDFCLDHNHRRSVRKIHGNSS